MASKKGIILTIAILIAITAGSFLVYYIPQNRDVTFVITDFESQLDGVKEIHQVISENVDQEFQNVLGGKITSEEFIQVAEISSSQINSQIIQLVESKTPEEWQESYLNYINSLRESNSYIRETIVAAKMIGEDGETGKIESSLEKITEHKSKVISLIEASDSARP